jgi:hypothetical protein
VTLNKRHKGVLLVVAVSVAFLAIGLGCSVSSGDAPHGGNDLGAMDAGTQHCAYTIRDGAALTCPADGKTHCLGPDGCNPCLCEPYPYADSQPMMVACTSHPCGQ